MKTGLTKRQKTTCIYFDEASKTVEIQTHNTALKKRLAQYAAKHLNVNKELGMKVSLIPKDNPSYEPNADAEEAAATSPTLDVFDVLLAGVEADD